MGDTATTIDTQTVEATATKRRGFYRPELDILRFCAFFSVYLTHSLPRRPSDYGRFHLPKLASELMASIAASGKYGVTLFFLLSAYLITSLLLREKSVTGDVQLRSFYIRRILRIWPLYFLALGLATVWPWDDRLPPKYLIGYLLLAGNWMVAIWGTANSWVVVLWSVSVEEQFYLSWPLAVKRMSRGVLLGTAVGLVVLANLTRIALCMMPFSLSVVWFNTFAQLDSFGAGILCAIVLNGRVPDIIPAKRWLLGCAGIGLLILAGYLVATPRASVIFGYPCATLGCLSLFLAVCGSSLHFRPLVYLGKISYGLYVFHWLALRIMWKSSSGEAMGTLPHFLKCWWGALALTIVLASLSYRWLETPFLHLKERFAVVKSRPV